jgi:hypothetical protein
MKDSRFGKNNFDKLEAAGLVAGPNDSENLKAKTEARVSELNTLITKVAKVQAYLAELYVLPKPRQLKRLSAATTALRELHATKLPTGAKRHIEACLNEVISLREGVYSSNTKLDKQTLALTASTKAKDELQSMVESAQHRLEKVMADSSSEMDMEEFYNKAADVIKKNAGEVTKVTPIADKPWIVARVPVVPSDGSLSAEKLPGLGFKSESLSGYPVIHNQLVLGVNPKYLASHSDDSVQRIAEMNQKLKDSGVRIEDINKAAGRARDLVNDLKKLQGYEDEKKGSVNPDVMKKAAQAAGEAVQKANDLVQKAGIDLEEYQRLQSQVKRSHAAQPEAIKKEAERLRKLLEKKTRTNLRFVSEKPGATPGKLGVWFWLMPDRELDMLAKASLAKRVSITRWGFAF